MIFKGDIIDTTKMLLMRFLKFSVNNRKDNCFYFIFQMLIFVVLEIKDV